MIDPRWSGGAAMKGISSVVLWGILASACTASQRPEPPMGHSGHATGTASAAVPVPGLPADEAGAPGRLKTSPRHGEWITIRTGTEDSIRTWVVYPERKSRAPVILVIHEVYGLTPWIRNVADQLAAEGFIAVAPDLLSMKNLPGFPDNVDRQAAVAAISTLQVADVQRQLSVIARHAMNFPSALPRYGIVGFCRGGDITFQHALSAPKLGAAVVFYGRAPAVAAFANIRAPVLGLYGGNDSRVNATLPATDSAMRQAGRTYGHRIYEGAGHGFLRQQTGLDGANAAAAAKGWPEAIGWFRKYLGS